MARKGGKRGGSSAARSAAAKKGWETRRRGGAKPAAPTSPKPTPKTTTARGRARTAETRARAALRSGGGTRAARSLATAQRARDWYKATGSGTKRSRTRTRIGPANAIRRTGGPRRAPLAGRMNAVRAYRPVTAQGRAQQGQRKLRRATDQVVKATRNLLDDFKKSRPSRDALMREVNDWQKRLERRTARDIANRSDPGVRGRIAGMRLSVTPGRMQRAGADVIRRRAARASAAAARGSKPAARAASIYGQQLAFTGSGKPAKAKSGIRPGPRNTRGTPKPKRKRKG